MISASGNSSVHGQQTARLILRHVSSSVNVPAGDACFLVRVLQHSFHFKAPHMILTGEEIRKNLDTNIKIEPYSDSQLNPNSYNLRLHNELLVYEEIVLDMQRPNRFRRYTIPDDGMVMNPNQLYLGRTVERTETHNLVPMLEGRSSIGRLGLFVHITAGFGDVGFSGYWTLEMFAVQPIRIYPGVEIAQIFYHTVQGDISEYSSEKYQRNKDIQPSLLYKDFEKESSRQKRLEFGETPETDSP